MKDSNKNTILGLMEKNNFLAKLFNLDVLFDRMDVQIRSLAINFYFFPRLACLICISPSL